MLGTLMELGISPIVTSGLIMQLLAGASVICGRPTSGLAAAASACLPALAAIRSRRRHPPCQARVPLAAADEVQGVDVR